MNTINFRGETINYVEREGYWKAIEAGEWEPASFDVLDAHITPGKVFIDIGAWVGALSLYAAKKGAVEYAVEPDPMANNELIQNIELNDRQIHYEPYAIADIKGWVEINSMTSDGMGNSESSLINRGEIGKTVKVMAYSLPSFIGFTNIKPANICLIKIDTEGSELLIIPGAADFLKKYKPTIYISFHPAWFPNLNSNIKMLCNILFPIYNFIGVSEWGKEYSINDFIAAMHSNNEHSFILKAK